MIVIAFYLQGYLARPVEKYPVFEGSKYNSIYCVINVLRLYLNTLYSKPAHILNLFEEEYSIHALKTSQVISQFKKSLILLKIRFLISLQNSV